MRVLDVIFFIYFLTHIPIALFVDFQGLFPSEYYHQQLVALKEWYCKEFRDPMMMLAPAWYKSLIVCELFQFPFFFVAAYGFFKGAQNSKWLRLPCIIYGSHVATTLAPIIAHVLLHDFSNEKLPSPRNFDERLFLLSIYSPYFLIPVALVLDALFSSAYRSSSQEPKQQQQQQQQQQHQKQKKNK
ncbi:hypothetical protein BsWGS_21741 [Bradybaena similaris]